MVARTQALDELQQRASALDAHAIVGVDMDYEVLGQGNMLMVTASGTAVTVEAVQSKRSRSNATSKCRGQRLRCRTTLGIR